MKNSLVSVALPSDIIFSNWLHYSWIKCCKVLKSEAVRVLIFKQVIDIGGGDVLFTQEVDVATCSVDYSLKHEMCLILISIFHISNKIFHTNNAVEVITMLIYSKPKTYSHCT